MIAKAKFTDAPWTVRSLRKHLKNKINNFNEAVTT